MKKKFWLAALAAFVVINVYGFGVYSGLLASCVKGTMEGIGRTEMLKWPYFFRAAVMALVMAFIYPVGYKGGKPWLEGLRFGLLIAILLVGATTFDLYATLPIAGLTTFAMYIPEFIGLVITGIVIGAIYGKEKGVRS